MQNTTEFRTGVISPIECVKEGFELIKPDYWLLFAIGFLGAVIGGVSLYILLGCMMCGIFYAYLRRIDGFSASLDDLWKGFSWFGASLPVLIAIVGPIIVVYGIIYVPFIMAAMMGSHMSQDELMAFLVGVFIVDSIFILIMVCFHTLLMFSIPLIVDRNLGGVKAMTTSARAVWKNLGGVAGLVGVNFVLMFAGYLALCVGVYFVIPIMIAGHVVAYRRVFPRLDAQPNYAPPPPNVYGNF